MQQQEKKVTKLMAEFEKIPEEDIASIHKSQARMAELRQRKLKLISQFEIERSKDELKIKRMMKDHNVALEQRMQSLQEFLKTIQDISKLNQIVGEGTTTTSSQMDLRPTSASTMPNRYCIACFARIAAKTWCISHFYGPFVFSTM
jgi:hypothetical protein